MRQNRTDNLKRCKFSDISTKFVVRKVLFISYWHFVVISIARLFNYLKWNNAHTTLDYDSEVRAETFLFFLFFLQHCLSSTKSQAFLRRVGRHSHLSSCTMAPPNCNLSFRYLNTKTYTLPVRVNKSAWLTGARAVLMRGMNNYAV